MIRVLIVDDHPALRRGIQELLTEKYASAECAEAADSREALRRVTDETWDLVILDINIPGRNGLEVLEEVKRLQPRTPVLMLSAYPEEDFALRSLKLGAAGYLAKGRTPEELLAAVSRVLRGGKYVTRSLAERLVEALGSKGEEAPHQRLSNRELQVLCLVARGKTIKEIAAELALSPKTVGTYRSRISEKIGIAGIVELTRYALKHRLVD